MIEVIYRAGRRWILGRPRAAIGATPLGSDSDLESFDAFDDDGALPLSVAASAARGKSAGRIDPVSVVHLVPFAAALFPRWNPETRTVVVDPRGLYDLGTRQSEILALRRICSRTAAA